MEQLDKSTIVRRLKEKDVTERMNQLDVLQYASERRAASVLVPLILCEDGTLKVLLTKRAKHLRKDGGDVAFPGGKQDEDDKDVTATALREAWEEVGLYQTDVEVISQLPPIVSRHGHFVTPITALIPEDFKPNINPNEVEDVFRVPLKDFLINDLHYSKNIVKPQTKQFKLLHFFNHSINGHKYVTYGLTAFICILTACIVYDTIPDYETDPGFDYNNIASLTIKLIESKAKEVTPSSKL